MSQSILFIVMSFIIGKNDFLFGIKRENFGDSNKKNNRSMLTIVTSMEMSVSGVICNKTYPTTIVASARINPLKPKTIQYLFT